MTEYDMTNPEHLAAILHRFDKRITATTDVVHSTATKALDISTVLEAQAAEITKHSELLAEALNRLRELESKGTDDDQ